MTLKEQGIKITIQQLASQGERIIRECESERSYTHRTHNLQDSYGYGVYAEGRKVASGYLGGQNASEPKKWYGQTVSGRTEIEQYLNNYSSPDGMELIIVAAMPYAEVLENGGASNGRFTYQHKYKVISMSYDKLKSLQGAFPGSSIHRIMHGQRI
jgi:hypothetical protein